MFGWDVGFVDWVFEFAQRRFAVVRCEGLATFFSIRVAPDASLVIAAAISVDAPRVTWDTDISIRPHRGDQGRPNQADARFCPGPSGTSGWPGPAAVSG